jgi:DNA-binding LytR/AlgR family response regulator
VPHLAAGVAVAALLVAFYCLAYTSLAGRPETLAAGLAWAAANVCPWLVAIEAAKRAPAWPQAAATLAVALLASLALGYLLQVSDDALGFEIIRRAPALAAAAVIVALIRSGVGHRQSAAELPLLPRQIDWIRAAGNYVELRANGRTIVHRSSIRATEQALAGHGFVRIHRSTLVRRDRIARVRPQDVVLHDGTHLKVGNRYRASLPQPETRPFVPQP